MYLLFDLPTFTKKDRLNATLPCPPRKEESGNCWKLSGLAIFWVERKIHSNHFETQDKANFTWPYIYYSNSKTRFLIAGKLKSLTDGAGPPYFVGETIAFLQMPVIPLKKRRLEIEPWHTKELITHLCSVVQNTFLNGPIQPSRWQMWQVTDTFPETLPDKYTLKYFIFKLETKMLPDIPNTLVKLWEC